MSTQIILERFKDTLFTALDETFEQVHGIYLDKGTALFETLATITAEEASRPVSATCANIAAQVNHVRFYLDVLEQYMQGQNPGSVDWNASWQIGAVTPAEWDDLIQRLKASYQRVLGVMRSYDTWEGEEHIGGALAILVHTAYHLGEIRQALCTIK
jgi:hypothetical protein